MNCTRLQTQLAFISANFTALTEAITRIQGRIELVQSLEIIILKRLPSLREKAELVLKTTPIPMS